MRNAVIYVHDARPEARGRTPDRRGLNEEGELETMELSHEPVPLREGGKEVVPWPEDHANVDPHRHLEKKEAAE